MSLIDSKTTVFSTLDLLSLLSISLSVSFSCVCFFHFISTSCVNPRVSYILSLPMCGLVKGKFSCIFILYQEICSKFFYSLIFHLLSFMCFSLSPFSSTHLRFVLTSCSWLFSLGSFLSYKSLSPHF